MTFITPTIPADANPGPLVYAELETAMLADGWTLEDTVVISTRTHKVLKSAAAGNTYGLDWFIDISYPTTGVAGGLMICPFEGYNSTTHVATRGPYTANNGTVDPTTYSRYGATTQALETQWTNSASYTELDTPLSTSSFGVWASVTRDRVILMSSTEAAQVSYAGFYTPTAAHVTHVGGALFPLVMTRLLGATDRVSSQFPSSSRSALTRVPKLSTINWGNSCIVGPNTMRMNGWVGGADSDVDNRVTSAPYIVAIGGVNWTTGAANFAGELDGIQCAWGDAVVVRGDTVTVDGASYVTTAISSNACILIEAV